MWSLLENVPVPMILVNRSVEIVNVNKSARSLGINFEISKPGLGNAINCIRTQLNNSICGCSTECSKCRLRKAVEDTFEFRENQLNIPVILNISRNNIDFEVCNVLLSTSFLEFDNSQAVLLVLEDVTSIINAEQALIDSEFRYKQITRAVTDYIYTIIVQENNEIQTLHTPACFQITGYHAEEFEADPKLWFRIIHEEDRVKVTEFLTDFINLKITDKTAIQYRIVRKDERISWVSNTLVRKLQRKNRSVIYDGVISDITERKRAEENLENQNRIFNTMLNHLPIGIVMIRASDGYPLIVNKQASILLRGDLTALRNVYKTGTFRPYPVDEMPVSLGLHGTESHIDDVEVEFGDGSRISLDMIGCPVYDAQNNIYATLIGFYDITARKNSELALRESETKLSIIFEYAHVGISLFEADGNIQYMNPAFCQIFGFQPTQPINLKAVSTITPIVQKINLNYWINFTKKKSTPSVLKKSIPVLKAMKSGHIFR